MSQSTLETMQTFEGEEILHNEKPSWAAFPWLLMASVAGLLVLVGAFGILYIWLVRRRTQYVVTNERVITIGGSGGRRTKEHRLGDLKYIETDQSFLGSLLGTGSVTVTPGGAQSPIGGLVGGLSQVVSLRGVADHQDIANTIRAHQHRKRSD